MFLYHYIGDIISANNIYNDNLPQKEKKKQCMIDDLDLDIARHLLLHRSTTAHSFVMSK